MDGTCKEAAEAAKRAAAAYERAAEAAKRAAAAYERAAEAGGLRARELAAKMAAERAAERAAKLAAEAAKLAAEAAKLAAEATRPRPAAEQEAAKQEAEHKLTKARAAIDNAEAYERAANTMRDPKAAEKARRIQTKRNHEKINAIQMALKAAMATHDQTAVTNVAALCREAKVDITALADATWQTAERRQKAEEYERYAKAVFEASKYAEAAEAYERATEAWTATTRAWAYAACGRADWP